MSDSHWQTIEDALDKAEQLAEIASDWHLDEVEINCEMVSIYDVRDEFKAALAFVREQRAAALSDSIKKDIGLCAAGIVLAWHRKTHDHILADMDTIEAAWRVEHWLGRR
jgi:hypothetical protein